MKRKNNSLLDGDGLLRVRQIIGDPNATPPIPPIIPVSRAAWWAGVASGRFPKPVMKIGSRMTFWATKDIRCFIESVNQESA